jgi:hypothetical protein
MSTPIASDIGLGPAFAGPTAHQRRRRLTRLRCVLFIPQREHVAVSVFLHELLTGSVEALRNEIDSDARLVSDPDDRLVPTLCHGGILLGLNASCNGGGSL